MKTGWLGMAIGAVLVAAVGLLAQKAAGAPTSALVVQALGLAVGVVAGGLIAVSGWRPGPRTAIAFSSVAVLAVLATLADPAPGVHRWAMIGPVALQPSLILLPIVVWGWSSVRASWALAGPTAALAVLMAAQPDAAACGGLFLALAGVGLARRSVSASEGATLVVALASTVWAATRPDALEAVAHVERVVVEALAANPALGMAAGLALIAVPGLLAWRAWATPQDDAATLFGLTGLWLGVAAASVVANYPVPVVGYGASSAIGWLLSVALAVRRRTGAAPVRFRIDPRRR